MFILYSVALGILIGYLKGGKLNYLIQYPLRWKFFAIFSFIIQLIIFSRWSIVQRVPSTIIVILHLASYLSLITFIILNRKVRGMALLGSGIVLNALVIFLNGGYMPAVIQHIRATSMAKYADKAQQGIPFHNSAQMTQTTMLPWLGDIFHLPSWLPFSNVLSIGDILITIGMLLFLIRNMRPGEKTFE